MLLLTTPPPNGVAPAGTPVPVGALALALGVQVPVRVDAYPTPTTAQITTRHGATYTLNVDKLTPLAGTTDRTTWHLDDTVTVAVRPGEVLLHAAPTDLICHAHRAPLARTRTCWNERITEEPWVSASWQLGEDSFDTWRHTDGTPCNGKVHALPLAPCPACGTHDAPAVTLLPYHDQTTCTACGHTTTRPIGD